MIDIDFIYNIMVCFLSALCFLSLKLSSSNTVFNFIITVLFKGVSLFCLSYSIVDIFKHLEVI